eukprot:scaffold55086_cov64-Phaeocystis_antarctica.AAC.10
MRRPWTSWLARTAAASRRPRPRPQAPFLEALSGGAEHPLAAAQRPPGWRAHCSCRLDAER